MRRLLEPRVHCTSRSCAECLCRRSQLVEEHAYASYDTYMAEHEAALKAAPVPEVARRYYESPDAVRSILEDSATRPKLRNLYDVFARVRDDEAEHRNTLVRLVAYDSLETPDGCEVSETLETA